MSAIDRSTHWHERATQVIPGGVSSPVRAFTAVGGTPRYLVTGVESHVWDADGNEYVDLVGSWGPMLVGHAHPHVVSRVAEAIEQSFSFGAPSPGEVLLAEKIIDRVPACSMVRFVSSGTEAVMTAVRLARAFTSRSLIVTFAGCYHGHSDALLATSGSGMATLGLPGTPGVTVGQARDTIVLDYNDVDAVTRLFAERGSDIAAIVTEAAPANMGVVPPAPGFNAMLASVAREHGTLLILDEVLTGFRISRGGWWGSVGVSEGWTPDLLTFGKVIGGGLPLAALGGRREVMELLAPSGPVYQGGTLSGNPIATAAGLATLELCDDELYAHVDARAREVSSAVSEALSAEGIPHRLQTAGNLFSFFLGDTPVTNFREAGSQDRGAYAVFFHALLDKGVSAPPSGFEAWFVSAALADRDVDLIASAARAAARRVAAYRADPSRQPEPHRAR